MQRREFCQQTIFAIANSSLPTCESNIEDLRQAVLSDDFMVSYEIVCRCRRDTGIAKMLLPELTEIVVDHEPTIWMAAAKAIGNLGSEASQVIPVLERIQHRGDALDRVVVAETRLKIDLYEAELVWGFFVEGLFDDTGLAPTVWILDQLHQEQLAALHRCSDCPSFFLPDSESANV
ncbi:MAG: hypothetical protein R3C49_27400 [Planctomycetaceae bacterium]